jgi:hypothetical protein
VILPRNLAFGLLLTSIVGCWGEAGIPVTGRLTFNGQPNSGEIIIEPINADGRPFEGLGSVTCYADEDGNFATNLGNDSSLSVPCRLTIRIAGNTTSGRPAAFDHQARPEKRVELNRVVSGASQLNLLITR